MTETQRQRPKGRVLIVGAGAMGCLWAAHLTGTRQVCFAPWQQQDPLISFQLKQTDGLIRDVTIPVCTVRHPPPDLVVLTTKAHHAEQALVDAQRWLGSQTPIALFQNGMGSQQAIARRFETNPVIAAVTTEGAFRHTVIRQTDKRQTDEQVVHAGSGETRLGGLNRAGEDAVASVADLLMGSGLKVTVDTQINIRLWQKLAINAGINPFTVLLDCHNGDIIGAPYFEQHIGSVCDELSALMNAKGIPTQTRDLERQVRHVAYQTMLNSSSMREDVHRGRATEIDMINGFIVRESERLGLDAPINRMLIDAVKNLVPATTVS